MSKKLNSKSSLIASFKESTLAPIKAGIDPMNKFVDRIIDDNLIKVEF